MVIVITCIVLFHRCKYIRTDIRYTCDISTSVGIQQPTANKTPNQHTEHTYV